MIIALLWFLIARSDEDHHKATEAAFSMLFALAFMIGALAKMYREP